MPERSGPRAKSGRGAKRGADELAGQAHGMGQRLAVREHGCNEVQGFLFSPPISAAKVTQMLAEQERPRLKRVS